MKGYKILWTVLLSLIIVLGSQVEYGSANTFQPEKLLGQAAELSCTDSDGGLTYDVAGIVSGVGPNGYSYTRSDLCVTSVTLKEFSCNGVEYTAQSYNCPSSCQEGACVTTIPTCTDADEDTYAIEGGACGPVDCDDTDPAVNPGTTEVCDNGIDDNCNGLVDQQDAACLVAYCADSDGGQEPDVFGEVSGVSSNGFAYTRADICTDSTILKEFFCSDITFSARSYTCADGCQDGACVVIAPTCTDADEDTFAFEGNGCGPVDCDDSDPAVNPGVTEVCNNGIDDNCNGLADAEDPVCMVCTDADEDTFAVEGGACGMVDCDDSDPAVNPGASEVCDNGIDDNCNNKIDADDVDCRQVPNVIVVGWDGVQRDHLLECYNSELPECSAGLPNLASLSSDVIYDFTVTNGHTSTKAGWAQIFTGYNAEVTGVYNNGIYQPIPIGYTVFEKLENHIGDESIVTMFISGKSEHTGGACIGDPTYKNGLPVIEDSGQPWCFTKDYLDYYENDLRLNSVVGNRALELLDTHKDDLIFATFIFRDPDVTGHVSGEDSYRYSQAIIDDDIWLGLIVNKLIELGIYDNTILYVVSDHGFDEGLFAHGNAPFTFFATNDPQVMREGDRKDIAPTILERYGLSVGAIGDAPAVNGYSLYSLPPILCVSTGEAQLDYSGSPECCTGLTLINLDKVFGLTEVPATGGTGDQSGYCTACGDGVCLDPENKLSCPLDCP